MALFEFHLHRDAASSEESTDEQQKTQATTESKSGRTGGLRRRLMQAGALLGLALLARKLRSRRAAKSDDAEVEDLSVSTAK